MVAAQLKRLAVVVGICVALTVSPAGAAVNCCYSDAAGFHHARFDRVSITVQPRAPAFNHALLKAMGYWNKLAGWKLFVENSGQKHEVYYHRFDSGCQSCAAMYPSPTEPYTSCQYYVWKGFVTYGAGSGTTGEQVIAHELGHCLGFDHQDRGIMQTLGPRPDLTFDRSLLTAAGYAN